MGFCFLNNIMYIGYLNWYPRLKLSWRRNIDVDIILCLGAAGSRAKMLSERHAE